MISGRGIAQAVLATLVLITAVMTGPAPTAVADSSVERPVLAFYYSWYGARDWGNGKMSDLPLVNYSSTDVGTIRRHIADASSAGIDGFISSWWGERDCTDSNFEKLLSLSEGSSFYSTIYFEVTSWNFGSQDRIVENLRYVIDRYAAHPNFLRYQGRPVIFFWDVKSVPTAPGQSPVDSWREIRARVDPDKQMIWSAETTDLTYMSVFDGIHLFSAATWSSNLADTDRAFRNKVSEYNAQHGTSKIWAAGVAPGYDDTRLSRVGSYAVSRREGNYYRESFSAAIESSPNWITVTSYNEWFEGSQIEPSVSYNRLYLDITKEYSAAYKTAPVGYPHSAFLRTWDRTDLPIASQQTARTWMWGPAAFATAHEPYRETAGGTRLVLYFDKSRMEINDLNGDQSTPWFVTNGLLVSEMVNGRLQVGNELSQTASPAEISVAGDPDDTTGPTYASFRNLLTAPARPVGDLIQEVVDRSGKVSIEASAPPVRIGYYAPETNHAVADVFWNFLNSEGPIHEGYARWGRLFDPVFYATGLPITEAYWAKVKIGGILRDVLVQAFERRVLTYTPANPEGWQIEMGNVGRHYYLWRYGM